MSRFLRYALFSTALLLVGLLVGFKVKSSLGGGMATGDSNLHKLQQAIYYLEHNYVKEVDENKLTDDAIKGILDGLDPHSFYIPADEMKQMEEEMEGSFQGIGVEFSIVEDTIYVVSALSGGPSERMGIQAGDRIVQVDDKTIAGIGVTNGDVPKYLKGAKGTSVKIGIKRTGVASLLTFTIVRDEIPIKSVNYSYMVRPNVGYIPVTRFAEKTYEEFHNELVRLKRLGMQTLVLDLRGNPGGYMNKAYEMADEFLRAGRPIVSTKGRLRDSNQQYESTERGDFEDGAIIVLIDYGSASASEIVSGAIQDHDRGLIVGVRSYGKGLVQTQKKFDDGSAMRIVVSEYFTPSGRCIQKPYGKTHAAYEHEILDRFESGELYDPSKVKFPDSLKFKTASGRTVYGGGGIFPDVFVPNDTLGSSRYLSELVGKDLFRAFAYQYVDNNKRTGKLPVNTTDLDEFKISPDMLRAFTLYAAGRGVPLDASGARRSQALIENRIKAYMGRRLFGDEGFFPVFHESDRVLQRAIDLAPVASNLARTGKIDLAAEAR